MDFLALVDALDILFSLILDFVDVALQLGDQCFQLLLVARLLSELIVEDCLALCQLLAVASHITYVSIQVLLLLDKLVCLFLLDTLGLTKVECLLLDLPVTINDLSRLLLYLVGLRLKLLDQILQCLLLVVFLL